LIDPPLVWSFAIAQEKLVDDFHTLNYLGERREALGVGVNHKWQGNFFDADGTRSEFMEADTADGLPSPMSHAPYYQ
jgi:hypothetical protein